MSFYMSHVEQEGWQKISLGESRAGTEIEIIPSAGAILNRFQVRHNNKILNIIEGFSSSRDFGENLEKGFKSAKLSPFVCRLKNAKYHWLGKEYQIKKFLLSGSAIHGLIYDAPFKTKSHNITETSVKLELEYEYLGEDPGYPFPFRCEVIYILEQENSLTIITRVNNTGNSNIPIVDGWHPYFCLENNVNNLELQICSENMLEYDSDLLPTGNMIRNEDFIKPRMIGDTHIDNGFLLDFSKPQPMCILRDQGIKIQIEIYPSQDYPYLQVYTPNHRRSIALENLSGAPDAFNNGIGLITLNPGEFKEFQTIFKVAAI